MPYLKVRLAVCIFLALWFLEITFAEVWLPSARITEIFRTKIAILASVGVVCSILDVIFLNLFKPIYRGGFLLVSFWTLVGAQIACVYYFGLTVMHFFQVFNVVSI